MRLHTLVFLLAPSLLHATDFGWDIRLNNYTGAELRYDEQRFKKNAEFARVRMLRVKSQEGAKTTKLRFKTSDEDERCQLTLKTHGYKEDARLLSATTHPHRTCRVDYTPGPHKAPLIVDGHRDQQPTPRITVSVLNEPENLQEGLLVTSLYCERVELNSLAPGIARIRHIERAGRTHYYQIVLKNGSAEDYSTLEKNAWNRCMRVNAAWFIVRDPEGLFTSTLPPAWRLRAGLKGSQRLRFEKPGSGKSPVDAELTVRLLGAKTNVDDDPTTIDDGVYVMDISRGRLVVEYRAPKELFLKNIDAFHLFIEGLTVLEVAR
jgi:hypothetical protein